MGWWWQREVRRRLGTCHWELATSQESSLITTVHTYHIKFQQHSYNQPARRSSIRVLGVSGFISPFNGAKCFLMREPMRKMTG